MLNFGFIQQGGIGSKPGNVFPDSVFLVDHVYFGPYNLHRKTKCIAAVEIVLVALSEEDLVRRGRKARCSLRDFAATESDKWKHWPCEETGASYSSRDEICCYTVFLLCFFKRTKLTLYSMP